MNDLKYETLNKITFYDINNTIFTLISDCLQFRIDILIGNFETIEDIMSCYGFSDSHGGEKKELKKIFLEFSKWIDSDKIQLCVHNSNYLKRYISLFQNSFQEKSNIKKQDITLYLSNEEFNILKNSLDLYIRVMAGQWDYIISTFTFNGFIKENNYSFTREFENNITNIRNLIYPFYKKEVGFGDMGIHNESLPEHIRIIYDIYKILMYESGCGGVYGYIPKCINRVYDINISIEECCGFIANKKNNKEYGIYLKEFDDITRDCDEISLPKNNSFIKIKYLSENIFYDIYSGDRIIKKHNNKLNIIKLYPDIQ